MDPGLGTATVAASADQGTQGGSGGGGQGNGGSGGGGSSNCTWMPDPSQTPGTQTGGYDHNMNLIPAGAPGQWYLVSCNGQIGQAVFVPAGAGGAPPPPPNPQQLLAQARAQLRLPSPAVLMSPTSTTNPAVSQYVNIPTWAWLDRASWAPVTATTTAGPVTVTATATPVQLALSYQDGLGGTTTATCNGPGTPYSDQLAASENPQHPILAASPDCGWVWEHSAAGSADERLQVSGHVVYNLAWAVTGAAGGGPLGALDSPTSSYRVTVGEIEAVITGGH